MLEKNKRFDIMGCKDAEIMRNFIKMSEIACGG